MPQLTPTLIQGSDKANQIDEKVMGVVDAIYGFLTDTGTPSSATVSITNALFDYYTDGADQQHFSNIRLIGPGDDNGVRIHDIDDPVGGEIRVRVDGDGELSTGDGDDIPTVHIESRTDTGGIDDAATYTPLVSINANGLYLHQEIPDIAGTGVTGDYELINRLDFIGTEIARVEDLIGSAGIAIDGEYGITTRSETVGTTPTVFVTFDTTNNGDTADVGDVLTLVSGGTGYNWEPQTDTIYTPVYASAGLYDTTPGPGDVSWGYRFSNESSGSWSSAGTNITVPIAGSYTVTFTYGGQNSAATAGVVTMGCFVGTTMQQAYQTVSASGSWVSTITLSQNLTTSSVIKLNLSFSLMTAVSDWAELSIQRLQTE